MASLKVLWRNWIYALKRDLRNTRQVESDLACLVRRNVPAFDRRKKT